ncbi:hypothetical protein LA733_3347 [Leptospira interrogans]|nr:hypothetical protein LA733_3347 [Leptospira interrogans]KWV23321.1 hypothetical protein LA702_3298 [Leptospira interrogans]
MLMGFIQFPLYKFKNSEDIKNKNTKIAAIANAPKRQNIVARGSINALIECANIPIAETIVPI